MRKPELVIAPLFAALLIGVQALAGEPAATDNLNSHVLNCLGSDGHHVYRESVTCPLGGEEFDALMLGTHSTYGVYLDWEPQSYMRFPVALPVCPANGFIVTTEDMSAAEIERMTAAVNTEEYQRLFAARHATFYLYAKLTELMDEPADDRWWFYRQASSEADACNAPERYREYALATVSAGEARLQELSSLDEEFWILHVVIPNMHRRLGDFDTAQEWLDAAAPALADEPPDEAFRLALRVLQNAIDERRKDRVPIREEELD